MPVWLITLLLILFAAISIAEQVWAKNIPVSPGGSGPHVHLPNPFWAGDIAEIAAAAAMLVGAIVIAALCKATSSAKCNPTSMFVIVACLMATYYTVVSVVRGYGLRATLRRASGKVSQASVIVLLVATLGGLCGLFALPTQDKPCLRKTLAAFLVVALLADVMFRGAEIAAAVQLPQKTAKQLNRDIPVKVGFDGGIILTRLLAVGLAVGWAVQQR